jgi:hypothetical protein
MKINSLSRVWLNETTHVSHTRFASSSFFNAIACILDAIAFIFGSKLKSPGD